MKIKSTLDVPDSVTGEPIKYARHDIVCPAGINGGLADESYELGDVLAPHEPLIG